MTPEYTPELKALIAGYQRFRSSDWHPRRDRWAALRDGQAPKVMIISCSDSRVDPAQIFDCDPGEIFVVRNVAALVPPYETTPGRHGVSAAVEFAVHFLGVREVIVLAHGMCGGCKAALTQEMHGNPLGQGGFVASWIALLDDVRAPIAEAYGCEGREAERAMEHAAVRVSLDNLRSFPEIKAKEEAGELVLRGAFFAISDGVLNLLDETSDCFVPAGV